ncbi:MAG: hypothetical protein V1753_01845 [Pseudomonadota bacterium]
MKHIMLSMASCFMLLVCAAQISRAQSQASQGISHDIWGVVGVSLSEPAASEQVLLFSSETNSLLDKTETDVMGRYRFSKLLPGKYRLVVKDIIKEVLLKQEDVRQDIDLDECPECKARSKKM